MKNLKLNTKYNLDKKHFLFFCEDLKKKIENSNGDYAHRFIYFFDYDCGMLHNFQIPGYYTECEIEHIKRMPQYILRELQTELEQTKTLLNTKYQHNIDILLNEIIKQLNK